VARGEVVAWFEGRSEFGPRALGHRSILADPRDAAMRDRVNDAVKRRERFRPFAPMVAAERADEYFELPPGRAPAEFMLTVARVRDRFRASLGAVTHVDGTARLQLVGRDRYPQMHRLLLEVERHTGMPVVLNTSLNRAGEPIVESPRDAVGCLLATDIDLLLIDGTAVRPDRSVEPPPTTTKGRRCDSATSGSWSSASTIASASTGT
jgi:carbamoyltransferase